MRRSRAIPLASVAMATLLLAACSGSSDGGKATADKDRKAKATTTTSQATATSLASTGTAACGLADPSDFSRAGVKGSVVEQGDVSETAKLTPRYPSTACSFLVTVNKRSYGVTVYVADRTPADALDSILDGTRNQKPVRDLGDGAYWEAHEPTSADDVASGKLWAKKGGRVVAISTVDTKATPKAALIEVARELLTR